MPPNFLNGKVPLVAALDIEGTLTPIEGWDFLAEKKPKETQDEVKRLREDGQNGGNFKKSLDDRFDIIKPTPEDIIMLQEVYCENIGRNVREVINLLRKDFGRVICISGGLQDAILPFAKKLGFDPRDIFSIALTPEGKLPKEHPLYSRTGKKRILDKVIAEERKKRNPQNGNNFHNTMIGDGMTDAVCRGDDVGFVAVGIRENVRAIADLCVDSFGELIRYYNN